MSERQPWRAASCDLAACSVVLPPHSLKSLDAAREQLRNSDQPIEEFRLEDFDCGELQAAFKPVIQLLESGPGFAIVDRLPLDSYSPPEARLVFWLLGQLIGPRYEQNSAGSALFDVRDTGQDVDAGARYAETNRELTFHTDNARSRIVPDYVALLCMQPAAAGGVSQLVNANAVYEELLRHHPRELETLYEPFCFDRRGLSQAEEAEVAEFPILAWQGEELLCRFIRLYIEVGHRKLGRPLTGQQTHALDVFEQTVRRPDLRVEFQMERGQIQITNNHWILHNRTAFVDHPDPPRKRHLIRLWLARATPDSDSP